MLLLADIICCLLTCCLLGLAAAARAHAQQRFLSVYNAEEC